MKITNNYLTENYTKKEENLFNPGNVLTGTISSIDKDDKVLININKNYSLKFDKSEISGNVGDSVEFTVVKNSDNIIKLKQNNVKNETTQEEIEKQKKSPFVKHNSTKENKPYIKILQKTQNKTYESELSLKKTKESLTHLSKTLGEMAIGSLTEMGLNPEKLNIDQTSDLVQKTIGKDTSEEAKDEEENIPVDLKKLGITEEQYYQYASLLARYNLPTTEQNLIALQNVQDKIEEVSNLNEASILKLIKNESDITLQDIYISKYSNIDNTNSNDVSTQNLDTNIENLDQLIQNLFNEKNIEFTPENLELAKTFISNDIEISIENLDKYNKLSNISDFIDKDYILENTAINIVKNQDLSSLTLLQSELSKIKDSLTKDYIEVKDVLKNVKVENIQNLIDKNVPVNLKNIVNELKSNKAEMPAQISENAISERLLVAKIQMKLTSEAIFRLVNSGIDINILPLKETISQLESIETDIYKNNLEFVGAEPSDENVSQMKQTMAAVQNIFPTNAYVAFDKIINSEIDFSINAINAEISRDFNAKKLIETFEILETTPKANLGDKISKLDLEFEKLLQNNNIPINDTNLKAAKILSVNNIDFDFDVLNQVKAIDSKLDYIHNNLHPLTVAKMIKDGINPANENIDDLINILDEFSNEYSLTSKEKIAEYILDMDKHSDITPEERQAIISVYRMLNLIEKNGSASIGTLLKSDGNLTLANLLEAANTYVKQKRNIDFDKKIDDKFGELKSLNISETNIVKSIENGLSKNPEDYTDILTKQIIDYATPKKLSKLINSTNFKDLLLEDILENLKQDPLENKLFLSQGSIENFLNKLKNAELNDKDSLNWLIKNNVPVTLANIENVREVIKNEFKISKNIEEYNENLKENGIESISVLSSDLGSVSEKTDILKNIENLENQVAENFDDIINIDNFDNITSMLMQNKLLKEKLDFNKTINKIDDGIYKLPIKLDNGKITDLNMYILEPDSFNEKETISLFLNLETNSIGNIQTYISLKNDEIALSINSDLDYGIEKLKTFVKEFEDILKEDFSKISIKFEKQEVVNINSSNFKEDADKKFEDLSAEFNALI